MGPPPSKDTYDAHLEELSPLQTEAGKTLDMMRLLMRWKVNNPGRVPPALKAGFITALRATAPLRMLPDFIIIGAQRAGSTSLFNYLAQHPDISPAWRKEIHFFDKSNYSRGLTWYRSHFPMSANRTIRRLQGRNLVTGEATPAYLMDPRVPQRIHHMLPDVKLLIALRNPIDRAFSQYRRNRAMGWEDRSFREAIELEPSRLAAERRKHGTDDAFQQFSHVHHSYLLRGHYAEQIARWRSRFPSERIYIVCSEEMYSSTHRIIDDVFRFLGVRGIELPGYTRFNASESAELDPDLRAELARYFDPHNKQLYELYGRDLGWI